jgi:DNA-binding transcriptional MerR regulator
MKLAEELLQIGRFARVTGLSVKALRHYDAIGLLEPAHVDGATGYRYYGLEQARDAELIRRLRALELPLDEIAPLLRADAATVRDRLAVHRARLEGRAVETQRILDELDRLIQGREELVPELDKTTIRFELEIKKVPERRVLLARERGPAEQMSEIIPRLIRQTHERLDRLGTRPAGAPVCVCPFPGEDGSAEVAVGWPVAADVPGAETLPGGRALVLVHRGPYESLSRSYRLLAEVMEDHGLRAAGDPVEVYESDPEQVPDPRDYVTVIEWPIGPQGALDAGGDWTKPAPPP